MAAVIVVTNMRKTHRLRDTRHLVDVAQETVEIEIIAVSYTHLDVYKRQLSGNDFGSAARCR